MIATVLLLALSVREPPTRTGDRIGTVTMLADRSLRYTLRSVECDGTVVHGLFDVKPAEARYSAMLAAAGAIRPLETKPVKAEPTEPCPRKRRQR